MIPRTMDLTSQVVHADVPKVNHEMRNEELDGLGGGGWYDNAGNDLRHDFSTSHSAHEGQPSRVTSLDAGGASIYQPGKTLE